MTCTAPTLCDVIADALAAPDVFKLPRDAANDLARQLVITMARRGHSGVDYYLPALHALTREDRNSAIRREFNGQNLRQVMRKYSVSRSTVYRVVRRGEMSAE
jgi:Mor family transcriptional regulator